VAWSVLIVEDDDDMSESLYDVLENRGYVVWRASNGREAIDIVTREALCLDVILLDMRMPIMDGREFLRARRGEKLLADTRVIMSAQPASLDEIGEAVFARLTKPMRIDDVLHAVERACPPRRDAIGR
jgi:CheY-like chemotaxis protein